jgi:hypothetical protein
MDACTACSRVVDQRAGMTWLFSERRPPLERSYGCVRLTVPILKQSLPNYLKLELFLRRRRADGPIQFKKFSLVDAYKLMQFDGGIAQIR